MQKMRIITTYVIYCNLMYIYIYKGMLSLSPVIGSPAQLSGRYAQCFFNGLEQAPQCRMFSLSCNGQGLVDRKSG